MQHPVASRARLADKLVESLDFAEPDEIQRLWAAEAVRRRDEIRSGQVKPFPVCRLWRRFAASSGDDL
jgi:hypothetical protein